MRKILCIDYFFPPLMGGWVGGFKVIRFLPEFQWRPIVISATENVRYGKDYSLLRHVPKEIEVHRVGHREPSKIWQYVRNRLKINFNFPDYYKSWYSPALREAKKILQKEKIDLIFSVSPTYTTVFIAMKLKKEFGIPWVAELEDAWSGNDYLNLFYEKTLIKPLRELQKLRIRRGEGNILKVADKTIVIHRQHKQQLCNLHGIQENKIELITDGYYEPDFTELEPRALYPDRLTIVFIGGIYLGGKEIVLKFLQVVNELDKNVEVVFIGRGTAGMQEISIPNLTLMSNLPKEKALTFASGGDFFLLITLPSAKWHTPSKTYDYLRLGKPILALVPEDGDAARTIREARAGFILSYDQEKMREQLKAIFDDWRIGKFKDFKPDGEYIKQFERKNLTRKLVNIFDEVIAERK